jgi:hypothetical protein
MRKILASVLLIAACTLAMGFILAKRGATGRALQRNSKDLASDGLVFISPTHQDYDKELAAILKKQDGATKEAADSVRPFSVILVNRSNKDVIAYAVQWEAVDAEGARAGQIDSYIQPGTLMGADPPDDEKIKAMGSAVRAHQSRLLFWGGFDGDLRTLSKGGGVDPQLAGAVSVTASLDCAVFDDGTAVGPDTSNFFSQVEGQVQAKKDLLRSIHSQYFSGKPPVEILDAVGALAAQPEENPSDNSPSSYYRYYRKQYAGEIAAIRRYEKDDVRTIMRALQPLKKKWKDLKKAEKTH